MKLAYFDMIGGASGDMILAALLDAGLATERLLNDLQALNLPGYELRTGRVVKNGFSATRVDVIVQDDVPERHLADILALLEASAVDPTVRQQASAIFTRLAEIEAGIHGLPVEQVHLHELGGIDTIIDVTGALSGMRALQIERVITSPFPLGRGFIQGAHGQIPLPAPATAALLQGKPVSQRTFDGEFVTPTAAALLTAIAHSHGPIPSMTLQAVGYGAGGRDYPVPNLLRLFVGEQPDMDPATPHALLNETLVLLETNLDDLNPEIYDYVLGRLFAAGALDATLTPLHMKKNRPGILLSVLCPTGAAEALSAVIFAETSTLGIRRSLVERQSLAREIRTVTTPYGPVRVKFAWWGENLRKTAPEYEDCRILAEASGVPLRQVYLAAQQAAEP